MANQKNTEAKKPNIFVRMGRKIKETFFRAEKGNVAHLPQGGQNNLRCSGGGACFPCGVYGP